MDAGVSANEQVDAVHKLRTAMPEYTEYSNNTSVKLPRL